MNIVLSYQPQHLPPPYAYAAVLEITISDEIEAQFSLEYLGRSEIPEDELRAEGFSYDDRMNWEGTLHQNWKDDIVSFSRTQLKKQPDETYLHISVDGKDDGFPQDINAIDMLFQELMQAVLETAKVESPLVLKLQDESKSFEIAWHFSNRTIKIDHRISNKWNNGRKLLKQAYQLDYDHMKYHKKAKPHTVNPGGDQWFLVEDHTTFNSLISSINTL
ncbi:hypothetical protein SAMN05421640_0957 [Ekhidna lutea]|uniref:Uncharacterized protein n=2 Tax=Ekhidna lutea TaxID=447679 RepID=A0A239GQZ0_EKHLU|nr:hypothetical protein SAMN05421640_0957 [Ekhidna lutea]